MKNLAFLCVYFICLGIFIHVTLSSLTQKNNTPTNDLSLFSYSLRSKFNKLLRRITVYNFILPCNNCENDTSHNEHVYESMWGHVNFSSYSSWWMDACKVFLMCAKCILQKTFWRFVLPFINLWHAKRFKIKNFTNKT